jgi:[CysO sulfur-carrier protein]-S-L-cysteine hydrolase
VVKGPSPEDWERARSAGSRPVLRARARLRATIPADLLQQLIDAARDGLPNEACGLLVAPAYAAEGGVPTRFIRVRNAAESPYRYYIDPADLLQIIDIEDGGEVVWGIFHSHVVSAAEPSATDVGLAMYPDSLYVICSLADPVPVVRAWSIRDATVLEVPLGVG